MRWLLKRLVRLMPNPRVIYDMAGTSPYLSRYYILGRPRMSDGSDPFDRYGNPHPDTIWPDAQVGLYLHHFHRGDSDVELHNHPWRWALSLILAGGYVEERRLGLRVVQREVRPGALNFIGADDFHRVDIRDDDAWSLFLVGPKSSSWGFWNRVTNRVVPWRDFINAKRDATAFARKEPA